MADHSQRDACYNDPTLLLLTEEDYFQTLYAAQTNASASFPLEAPSYIFSNWIISIYSIICRPSETGASFACYPQARLEGDDPDKDKGYRAADFGQVLLFDRRSELDWVPSEAPRMISLAEIKPKNVSEDWRVSTIGLRQSLRHHIPQVSEQAYFTFRNYAVRTIYTFIMMGNNFVLLEYQRPDDLDSYHPCKPPDRVTSEQILADYMTTNPKKRRRMNSLPGPPPQMLRPIVHFAFEDIIKPGLRRLDPFFLKALDITTASHVVSRQPSWFQVPPGDLQPSELSCVLANECITLAADKVSGKTDQEMHATAKILWPSPASPDDNQDAFKPGKRLENSATGLEQNVHNTRSRANSLCAEDANRERELDVFDSEPGPSSSKLLFANDNLGRVSAEDGASPPPDSSGPPSSAHSSLPPSPTHSSLPPSPTPWVNPAPNYRKTASGSLLEDLELETIAARMKMRVIARKSKAQGPEGKDTKGKGRAI